MAVVSVEDLNVAYGNHQVISDLSFTVNEGDFMVVIGENGVGKTTLVRALLGLIKPHSGEIDVPASNLIGYVPQFRNIDEEYPLSIRDFVSLNVKKTGFPWLSKKSGPRSTG